jgi:hypothetical protein
MTRLFVAAAMILGCCPAAFAAEPILCQGEASGYLQGFDSDGEFIYWSMLRALDLGWFGVDRPKIAIPYQLRLPSHENYYPLPVADCSDERCAVGGAD